MILKVCCVSDFKLTVLPIILKVIVKILIVSSYKDPQAPCKDPPGLCKEPWGPCKDSWGPFKDSQGPRKDL